MPHALDRAGLKQLGQLPMGHWACGASALQRGTFLPLSVVSQPQAKGRVPFLAAGGTRGASVARASRDPCPGEGTDEWPRVALMALGDGG